MQKSWWAGALFMLVPLLARSETTNTPSGENAPGVEITGKVLSANTPACEKDDCDKQKSPVRKSESVPVEPVVVTSKRASLATAQETKQEKLEIVDSVVADTIQKLPDISVGEALQRITGVQINRDRGESTQVTIRGLTQVETLLNGREVFTAGNGRNLDFSDFPSEMISAINVYKTSSAEHIEGGIGGMIDLRTRRPFDFNGREIVVSGRAIQSDLVDKTKQQFSILASDRWGDPKDGEFGALFNLVHQERAWREDQESLGAYEARAMGGQTVNVPTSILESTSAGSRRRSSGNVILQWRPTEALDLYAEGSYTEFRTIQNGFQFFTASNTKPTTFSGTPILFSGTNDLKSINWTNVAISTQSFARDTVDRTTQLAIGGSWTQRALTLKTDLSYTKSFNNLFFLGSVLNGTAANLTQNISRGNAPDLAVAGTNLLDPSTYTYSKVSYAFRPFQGELKAAQFDAEYQFPDGFLDTLSAGIRYAERDATSKPGQISGTIAIGIPATDDLTTANPYSNFFPGSSNVGNYLVGNTSRNLNALLTSLGISASIPTSNPLGTWSITEKTGSGYLMTNFKLSQFDGNAGMRIVHTNEQVLGSTGQIDNVTKLLIPSTLRPVDVNSSYTDVLPSINLRYKMNEGLYLRAAASKTLTRPDFNQMSPSLTLNPVLLAGSAGNPALKPVRADNQDLAVERYFNPTTSIYLTAFFKQVDGFVATSTNNEVYGGDTYRVSRPFNTGSADINGVEVGYQQFYDFLPGWLSGLGLQANYTYIDSQSFNKLLNKDMPLQNISRNNYNLIGMYEKGPLSIRVAYNWRDKFLTDVTTLTGIGPTPVYMKAYGWLDASISYRLSKQITLAVEGMNLLRTVRQSYYGSETRPKDTFINDRQIAAVVTVQF